MDCPGSEERPESRPAARATSIFSYIEYETVLIFCQKSTNFARTTKSKPGHPKKIRLEAIFTTIMNTPLHRRQLHFLSCGYHNFSPVRRPRNRYCFEYRKSFHTDPKCERGPVPRPRKSKRSDAAPTPGIAPADNTPPLAPASRQLTTDYSGPTNDN
jgi:hypothetical protein